MTLPSPPCDALATSTVTPGSTPDVARALDTAGAGRNAARAGTSQRWRFTDMRQAIVVALVVAGAAGCATVRAAGTRTTEEMLSAAGFHVAPADTAPAQ